jgi:hypothetical protein
MAVRPMDALQTRRKRSVQRCMDGSVVLGYVDILDIQHIGQHLQGV